MKVALMAISIGLPLATFVSLHGLTSAQTSPQVGLDGAFFRFTYSVPADIVLLYHYDFTVERGRGRFATFEDNVSQDRFRRLDRPMTCKMNGLTCDLCCGKKGTLGGAPGARHTITIAPDGRSAVYQFTDAQGRQHEGPKVLIRQN